MNTDSILNKFNNNAADICVCIGQTCTSLGSQDILKEIRKIKEKRQVKIDLTYQNCFSRCEHENGLCPTLKLNNEWIDNATPAKIKEIFAQKNL